MLAQNEAVHYAVPSCTLESRVSSVCLPVESRKSLSSVCDCAHEHTLRYQKERKMTSSCSRKKFSSTDLSCAQICCRLVHLGGGHVWWGRGGWVGSKSVTPQSTVWCEFAAVSGAGGCRVRLCKGLSSAPTLQLQQVVLPQSLLVLFDFIYLMTHSHTTKHPLLPPPPCHHP